MLTRFNVGDKVLVVDVDAIDYGAKHYYNGMETEIIRIDDDNDIHLRNKDGGEGIYVGKRERHAIELITEYAPSALPASKKSARITALETQVATLQAKVEALEKAGKYPLTAKFERESPEVDGILADIERKSKPTLDALLATYPPPVKSANEQRADVIKRAKAFVSDYRKTAGYTAAFPYAKFDYTFTKFDFIVNSEKRTVVALITPKYACNGNRVLAKGIAKCDPDDVFNADIGKAIALARALGVEVPEEFVKAVQPTEVVVGMRVYYTRKYPNLLVVNGYSDVLGTQIRVGLAQGERILEDTDAVYE